MPRFGPGDVATAAPSAPVLADRTACPGSPALTDLHRPGRVEDLQTGCPVCQSLSRRPASSRTSNSRRRALRLRSCVAARPASKARPDRDHVAVVHAVGRAPSSAVDDEAGALTSSILLPRGAIPFEGFSSPAAVPRHRGPCPLARRPHHPSPVLPREMGWVRPADHKALLHCRVRCRPRCCHRWRPVPSLGLRTCKTFRRFRECETSFWCSPARVRVRRASVPKRSVSAPTVTTGLAMSRRSGSGPTCAGPSPGAEAPRSGQSHRRAETNLRSLAVTSSGASRRNGYGALDDLPSLPTGS